MKLFIMTDLEGVSGVLDVDNWLWTDSAFNGTARRLLTEEINAAVRGFAESGFDDIIVCHGHGSASINIELLDRRVRLLKDSPLEFGPYTCWPFGIDETFDALAFVGQHAKAGSEYSHLSHTGNMSMLDISVNGISVGEYGELVMCAGERGVPVIFASGDKALCKEAEELTPWVVTASVKEGNIPGAGNDLPVEEYTHFHEGAVHLHPEKARELICAKAAEAGALFRKDKARFRLLEMKPPHKVVSVIRSSVNMGRPGPVTVSVEDDIRISTALNKAIDRVEKIIKP